MTKKSFRGLFEEAGKHLDYWVAGAEIEFTEELARVMQGQSVSRAELARRIGTSQAYVTKVFRGNANFTLTTMVKLSRALGMDLRLHLARQGAVTHWKDEFAGLNEWRDYAVDRGETEKVRPRDEHGSAAA